MECSEVADNDQLERNQERYHYSMERNQVSDYFCDCFCKIFYDKRMERSENSNKHQLEWYQNSHYDSMEQHQVSYDFFCHSCPQYGHERLEFPEIRHDLCLQQHQVHGVFGNVQPAQHGFFWCRKYQE